MIEVDITDLRTCVIFLHDKPFQQYQTAQFQLGISRQIKHFRVPIINCTSLKEQFELYNSEQNSVGPDFSDVTWRYDIIYIYTSKCNTKYYTVVLDAVDIARHVKRWSLDPGNIIQQLVNKHVSDFVFVQLKHCSIPAWCKLSGVKPPLSSFYLCLMYCMYFMYVCI